MKIVGDGPLLELKNVTHSYRAGKQGLVALENMSFALEDGEFVAIVGPSGCGKSTLLRLITGLQEPTRGEVIYRGRVVQGVNPYATIVFQTFALFPWLTVQENVEIALEARGLPASVRAPRALELLDTVGLDGFESAYPRELSGGMRQKVGFARAMAVEPELLCLDEAFSALDVLSAENLRNELLELRESGKLRTRLIILVSHNIEEAVSLADRIIVMEKQPGRIVADFKLRLGRPRQRKSPEFLSVVDRVYATLAGQTQPEHVELGTAPGQPGRTRGLPHVAINSLLGLVEYLNETQNQRADLYHLAEELRIDSNDLLQLTEVAELLGFATISHGDISLTTLGETFAEASILARKEIFGSRVRRVPLFQWLLTLLESKERKEMSWNSVQAELEQEFPPEEAQKQLDTAVSWGRYAELLAYDDSTGLICLEPGGSVVAAEVHQ